MPRKGIHTVRKTLADGTAQIYRYAWRGGPRLYAEPGTDAFDVEYGDAKRSKMADPDQTLAAYVTAYLSSEEFKKLGTGTKRYRARYCGKIKADLGSLTRDALHDPKVRGVFIAWRNKWMGGETPRPRAADLAIETLSVVLSHAKLRGDLSEHYAVRIPKLHKSDRSEVIWTKDEIDAVKAKATPACVRLIDLARLTGLRRGDCIRLPWSADKGSHFDWKTRKTGSRVMVPILPELRALLNGWPVNGHLVLSNSHGAPWTDDSSDNAWQRAKRAAGATKRFHDLRGTFATLLCERSLSDERVAGIMGWSQRRVKEIREHYVGADAIMADVLRQLDLGGSVNRSVNIKLVKGP